LDNLLVQRLLNYLLHLLLDTLKVRLQVTNRLENLTRFVQTILKNDGISSLWRGSTVAFLGQICENTTSFVLNAHIQRLLPQNDDISHSRSFFIGSVAGIGTAMIICPMETIKCQVQVAQVARADQKHSVRRVMIDIFRSQGIKGLYHGIAPQMARDIPGSAIYFGCYDALYHTFHQLMEMGTTESCLLAGGLAGQIYWFTCLPMDRIKSIIQTQRYDCIPGSHPFLNSKSLSPFEGLRVAIKVSNILYSLHGIRGFYQGGTFAVVRAFPTNASLFYGYKSTRRLLDEMTGGGR
jgi:hypothetical protein